MSETRSARVAASTPSVDMENQNRPDVSSLRQPIKLGTEGVVQIVRCLQSATKEVTDVLLFECNIIYECRVCKSLFRGLTNLLAHKRAYCLLCYSDLENPFVDDSPEDDTVILHPEPPPPDPEPCAEWDNYIDSDCESAPSSKSRRSESGREAKSVVEQLQDGSFQGKSVPYTFYTRVVEKCEKSLAERKSSVLNLSEIKGTKAAVLQQLGRVRETSPHQGRRAAGDSRKSVKNNHNDSWVMESDSTSASKESFKENLNTKGRSGVKDIFDTLYVEAKEDQVTYIEPCSPTGYINMSLRKSETNKTEANKGEKTAKKASREQQHSTSNSGKSKGGGSVSTTHMSPKSHLSALGHFKQCDPAKRQCLKCKKHFSAVSTLLRHMKEKHMPRRTVTKCPLCDVVKSRSYAVVAHLREVHKKNDEEIEKLKDLVYKKCQMVQKNKTGNNLLVRDWDDKTVEQVQTSPGKSTPKPSLPKPKLENKPEATGSTTLKVKVPVKTTKTVFDKSLRTSTAESVALKLGGGFRCLRCGTIFGKADILAKHQQKCTASKRLSDVISPSRQTPSSPPASADTVENVFEKFQKNLAHKSTVTSPKKMPDTTGQKKATRAQSGTPEPRSDRKSQEVKTKSGVQQPQKRSDGKNKTLANDSISEEEGSKSSNKEKDMKKVDKTKADGSSDSGDKSKVAVNTASPKPSPKQNSNKKTGQEKSNMMEKRIVSSHSASAQEKTCEQDTDNQELKTNQEKTKEKQPQAKSKKSIGEAKDKIEKPQTTMALKSQGSGQNHSRTRSAANLLKPTESEKSENDSTNSNSGGKSLAEARAERLRARRRLSDGETESVETEKGIKTSAAATTTGAAKRKRESDENNALPNNTARAERSNDLRGEETKDGSYTDSVRESSSCQTEDSKILSSVKSKDYDEQTPSVSETAIKTETILTSVVESLENTTAEQQEEETALKSVFVNRNGTSDDVPVDVSLGNVQGKESKSGETMFASPVKVETSERDIKEDLAQDETELQEDIGEESVKSQMTDNANMLPADLSAPHVQIRVLGSSSEAKNKLKDKIIVTVTEPKKRSLSPEPKKGGMVLDYRKLREGSKIVKGISEDDHKKILSLVDTDNLSCTKCGGQFKNVSNLHRHAVRHLGWRRYKCTICKGTFFNRSECRRHIRLIHERKMAVSLNAEDYMVDLEPDKMKTQSITMPRVEIQLQRMKNQQLAQLNAETSGFCKKEQNKGDMSYNISTRKTSRSFDTSPFPREDDDSKSKEDTDNPDDLPILCTRSGIYKKTDTFASSSKASVSSMNESNDSPVKKARYSLSGNTANAGVDSGEGASVSTDQFMLASNLSLSSINPSSSHQATKSTILTNVVAKPAFVIDTSCSSPDSSAKDQTFPPYRATDKGKRTKKKSISEAAKDSHSVKAPKPSLGPADIGVSCSDISRVSDNIVLRSPHQLGKQDWLSEVKELPLSASAFGDIQIRDRQMVTIMNADGTVLGKVPVSVQKQKDPTTGKEETKDLMLMLMADKDLTEAGSQCNTTFSVGETESHDLLTQSLQLVPMEARPHDTSVTLSNCPQSVYLRVTQQKQATGNTSVATIEQTKDIDLNSSTQALLNKIQEDIPSDATLEDHEVAMATSLMGGDSSYIMESTDKSSFDKLVMSTSDCTTRSEGFMNTISSVGMGRFQQEPDASFPMAGLPGNNTVTMVTESPSQLPYASGDELLQMINSDQSEGKCERE